MLYTRSEKIKPAVPVSPCPFCGSVPTLYEDTDYAGSRTYRLLGHNIGCFLIHTVQEGSKDMGGLLDSWNQRQPTEDFDDGK